MDKWDNLSNDEIINGKNADGVSYLGLFLNDYTIRFKPTEPIYAGCRRCLNDYIYKYKNFKDMEVTNSSYKLKLMFEGITLFGTGLVITNKNLTDKIAKKLLAEHPHGKELFDFIPEEVVAPKPVVKKDKK